MRTLGDNHWQSLDVEIGNRGACGILGYLVINFEGVGNHPKSSLKGGMLG